MTKKQFMQDPLGNAKTITGTTKNCPQVQRLIAMVSDHDVPEDATIEVTTSSDWLFMQRRAMVIDTETGKGRLAEKPRCAYCYGWNRIAASGSGGYCRPWKYAYAMEKKGDEQ